MWKQAVSRGQVDCADVSGWYVCFAVLAILSSFFCEIEGMLSGKIRGSLVLVADLSLRIYLTYIFLSLGHKVYSLRNIDMIDIDIPYKNTDTIVILCLKISA